MNSKIKIDQQQKRANFVGMSLTVSELDQN